ncbi:MAG: sigma-70 family RNA polymerase sigma factor [Gemmataceae bacterium]|nr:sigma-70 family RNA polymerase sigma factor [Gemmataceae bacterium]MDW8266638.1 sigma-70 family RNA polymerase sigma factor [Gemmataceae bacterium]
MPPSPEDRALLESFQAGDPDAARRLFDGYVDRLLPLARRRLSQRLASRVDAEDIVQSVFRTFFKRLKAGRFRIDDQDDLCKLLVRITVHKTLRQIAFHKAAKRDPSLEAGQGTGSVDHLRHLLDQEPTPEAQVAFLDELESFLSQLRPQEREILELRMQGYSNEEIAQKLGIYDRKIRRVIERVRALAEQSGLGPAGH